MQAIKHALVKYVETLEEGNWRPYLSEVLLGLRCLVHRAHGFSPYMVIHGIEPELPAYPLPIPDVAFHNATGEEVIAAAERLAAYMQQLHAHVKAKLSVYDSRSKAYYDRAQQSQLQVKFEPGDTVLLRQHRTGGIRLPA